MPGAGYGGRGYSKPRGRLMDDPGEDTPAKPARPYRSRRRRDDVELEEGASPEELEQFKDIDLEKSMKRIKRGGKF